MPNPGTNCWIEPLAQAGIVAGTGTCCRGYVLTPYTRVEKCGDCGSGCNRQYTSQYNPPA